MKIPHCSKHLVGRWPYQNGEIHDSVYESHWFLEEIPWSSKGRQLDLNKLFNGNVPVQYVRGGTWIKMTKRLAQWLTQLSLVLQFQMLIFPSNFFVDPFLYVQEELPLKPFEVLKCCICDDLVEVRGE